MTDDHTSTTNPKQATTGLRQRLEAVLPPWTHWGGGLFGPTTAKWTMPGGTWSLWLGGLGSPWPRLEGPGGTWTFGSKDAEHIIGVLRALDAIDAGSQPGRYAQEPDEDLVDRVAQAMRDANTPDAWRTLGPQIVPFHHFAKVAIDEMERAAGESQAAAIGSPFPRLGCP